MKRKDRKKRQRNPKACKMVGTIAIGLAALSAYLINKQNKLNAGQR